jgi:hypothetical protein
MWAIVHVHVHVRVCMWMCMCVCACVRVCMWAIVHVHVHVRVHVRAFSVAHHPIVFQTTLKSVAILARAARVTPDSQHGEGFATTAVREEEEDEWGEKGHPSNDDSGG